MAENFTTAYTSRDPSATGIQKRTVNDWCRNLFHGASTLLALVTNGKVNKGEVTQSPGMLGKRSCSHRRYEFFTYTPWVTVYTVTGTGSGTVDLDSVTGLSTKRTMLNDRTLDVARVSAIATLTVTYQAITSTFTCAAGDKILVMAPAYEEASSSPNKFMKNEDNNYNVHQIVRYPWEMSKSAMKSDNYIYGKNYADALGKRTMIEGNLLIERSMLFSERATTTTTDLTTDATLGDSFGTMRGFANWAQKSYDAGNAMTPEKFITEIPLAMSNTISNGQRVVAFTSRKVFGEMQMWIHDKYIIDQGGELKKYGVKSMRFMTAGPEIEVIPHALFDNGKLQNKMFIMCPDDALYIYRDGRDIHVNPKEIQSNSSDSVEREVLGEITVAELTGGLHCCMVSNWYAL